MFHNQFPPQPPGWKPPYSGAPPVPTGWNVNPQQWQSGFWQPNPSFNFQQRQPSQHVPWIPSQAWQQQAGQSHNPYKRYPKPPSAEYLATKLSDNPLGLSNMIPREQLYKESEGSEVPHTPWIWYPRGLVEDESKDGIITADYRDQDGRRILQEVRGPAPTRRSSVDPSVPPPDATPQPPHSASQSQESSVSPAAPQNLNSASRSHTVPEISSIVPQTYTHASSQANRDSAGKVNRPRQSTFQYGPPVNAATDAAREAPPGVANATFTTAQPLRTTFSPGIVRTPDHYKSTASSSSRNNSASDAQNTLPSSRSIVTSNSLDSQLASRMDRLSTASQAASRRSSVESQVTTRAAQPVTRHRSLPTESFSQPSSQLLTGMPLYEEPGSATLSPLVVNTPKTSSARPIIARGESMPTIPEARTADPAPRSGIYDTKHSARTESIPMIPDSRTDSRTMQQDSRHSARTEPMPMVSNSRTDPRSAQHDLRSAARTESMPTIPESRIDSRSIPHDMRPPVQYTSASAAAAARKSAAAQSNNAAAQANSSHRHQHHASQSTPIYTSASSAATQSTAAVPVTSYTSASAAAAASQVHDQPYFPMPLPPPELLAAMASQRKSSGDTAGDSPPSTQSSYPTPPPSSERHGKSQSESTFGQHQPGYHTQASASESRMFVPTTAVSHSSRPQSHIGPSPDIPSGASTAQTHYHSQRTSWQTSPYVTPSYPGTQPQPQPQTSPHDSVHLQPQVTPEHRRSRSVSRSRSTSRQPSPSSSRYSHITPPSSSRHQYNPLPRPPEESSYYSYDHNQSSSRASESRPIYSGSKRLRKGFWNKRGDHLTATGKIVYAPGEKAYPSELRNYPSRDEGYKDEYGDFIPYDSHREELMESLPRHGQAPSQPYGSFIIYVNVPVTKENNSL